MWEEDVQKTQAGNRSICISARLGAALEYMAGRTEGYLFQNSAGSPWDASNVLVRKLNNLLTRLEIPKIDPKLLAKFIGKDRTIEQATPSEKRAASFGLHSLRHANATAMDSLGIPQQIRKHRLGHSGTGVTENYTHTFTQDERMAAEKLGELFGTGWPEREKGKLISFPNLSQTQERPARPNQQAIGESVRLVAGGRFEPPTFGLCVGRSRSLSWQHGWQLWAPIYCSRLVTIGSRKGARNLTIEPSSGAPLVRSCTQTCSNVEVKGNHISFTCPEKGYQGYLAGERLHLDWTRDSESGVAGGSYDLANCDHTPGSSCTTSPSSGSSAAPTLGSQAPGSAKSVHH